MADQRYAWVTQNVGYRVTRGYVYDKERKEIVAETTSDTWAKIIANALNEGKDYLA